MIKTLIKLLFGIGSVRSYGQFGEDAVAGAMLKKIREGYYVDVGAYHPTLYSNTYALYRRGWSGIIIEPNREMEQLYRVFRSRDRFIHAAVGKEEGELTYYHYQDGAYNSLDPAQVEALAAQKGVRPVSEERVPVHTLSRVVHDAGLTRIDFMNIDVEGMDVDVLASYDWHIRPSIVAVEIHGFDADSPSKSPSYVLLREKGYELTGMAGLTFLFRDRKPALA